MKIIKPKTNIKKTIKAKIEFVRKKQPDKPQIVSKPKKQSLPDLSLQNVPRIDVPLFLKNPFTDYTTNEKDTLANNYRATYNHLKKSGYKRSIDIDYEVIICISSYNRFEKVQKLISMFYEQKTKYSFKIIFLNDASTDQRYDSIKNKYPELEYIKNTKNNGRKLYWYTVTQLWQKSRSYRSNMLMMIDDDFLLCNNFLNTICDFFFHIKEENDNVIGIAPHLHSYLFDVSHMEWWYNTYSVDGVCLFDRNFIESFDYRLEIVTDEELNAQAHAHGWSQIQNKIRKDNKMVYKTRYSLAYHDGNDESRLGAHNARKAKAYTYYFKEGGVNYKDLMV